MRTVVYARLSRSTATNELNLVDQVTRCREYAAAREWQVVEVVEDLGESAFDRDELADRPGFGRVLELVKAGGVDAVLAWRPDRLWRDPIEAAVFLRACQRAGVGVVATVLEGERDPANPGDEMVSTITAAVGRYESSAKSARLQAKARQLAEAGRPHGGPAPFGYLPDRTLNEVEAAVVREMAARVLSGESSRSIARALNDRGIRTRLGREWHPSAIRRTLTAPWVAGLRQHRGRIIGPATWPPILDQDLWMQVCQLMTDPARRVNTVGRHYLLTGGLARCGVCDGPLIARPHTNGARRYCCPSTTDPTPGCGRIQRLADPVEAEVLARLWVRVDAGDFTPPPSATVVTAAVVNDADAKLTELARDYYVLDAISKAEYLAARAPLAEAAERARAAHRNRPAAPRLPVPTDWQPGWPELDPGIRQTILRSVIEAVIILPAVRGSNQFNPDLIITRWK